MKYEVSLEYTHEFEIDCKGLCKWAETNLNLTMQMRTDSWIAFAKEGELTPTEDEDYKSDEHKQLIEYYNSLEESTEEMSLAAPSRLEGEALNAWILSKKGEIAQVTDFSTLTESQKKI